MRHKQALTVSAVLGAACLAVKAYIFFYILQLEATGCTCSDDFRRTYAKFYLTVLIFYAASMLFLAAFRSTLSSSMTTTLVVLPTLVVWQCGVLYVIWSLQYVSRLKREKCECASNGRVALEVWQISLYAQTGAMTLSFLLGAFALTTTVVGVVVFRRTLRSVPRLWRKKNPLLK